MGPNKKNRKTLRRVPQGTRLDNLHFLYKWAQVSISAFCSDSTGSGPATLGPRNHRSISYRLVPRAMQGWKLFKNNDFIWKSGGRNRAELTCIYPQGLSLDVRNNISSVIHKHSVCNSHNLHLRSLLISDLCVYVGLTPLVPQTAPY